MDNQTHHTFHIPVLGIGYSIDTPVKVARFGISSVISVMDDGLIERMREYYCHEEGKSYEPIPDTAPNHRAERITSYLDLVQEIVQRQLRELRELPFTGHSDIQKYFELLPNGAAPRQLYTQMTELAEGDEKNALQKQLRQLIIPGSIDVNVMVKIDRLLPDKHGNMPEVIYSDALAAFRGFALSQLQASIVLSAGYNPRLFNYMEQFDDFYPDEHGYLKKKIVLKVSDYRSAIVQGKILAKKGLWISEFRIESGLNCGGHAFATDGMLLGPILEEFRNKRNDLKNELFDICNAGMVARNKKTFAAPPRMKITVQGGIGTANENSFLMEHYELDGTGWGSPFLLVPEATNVDPHTLRQLATAKKEDYFTSYASPLGIAFNNFKPSSGEQQRTERIARGRAGSPCYKQFLISDTEFTKEPICTASREYQHLKLEQLEQRQLPPEQHAAEYQRIVEKECLCEGLGSAVLLKYSLPLSHRLAAVTICPGPNLAYFSGIFSLADMVDHIYGRINLLNKLPRPNLFINELHLYLDHLKKKIDSIFTFDAKQEKYIQTFKGNLMDGINYYKKLVISFTRESSAYVDAMKEELERVAGLLTMPEFSSAIKLNT